MKKILVVAYFLSILVLGKSQTNLTETKIRIITDSILSEGNLLFKYERAAWMSTDLARENGKVKKEFSSYLVYQRNDTIKALILNRDGDCLYELSYFDNFYKPCDEIVKKRKLTELENRLLSVKQSVIGQIIENKYEVTCPEEFNLNFVLIPSESGYRFYILTGTGKSDVIPFGNDYLFLADDQGKVTSWKKIHSGLIPAYTKMEGDKIVMSMMHSHRRAEPFISATDICTFKLYAPLYDFNSFSVYSPALSKTFTYYMDKNIVEIKDGLLNAEN